MAATELSLKCGKINDVLARDQKKAAKRYCTVNSLQ